LHEREIFQPRRGASRSADAGAEDKNDIAIEELISSELGPGIPSETSDGLSKLKDGILRQAEKWKRAPRKKSEALSVASIDEGQPKLTATQRNSSPVVPRAK
jgi:hypothetical protein